MKQTFVHLGFEVGTGQPVQVPVSHLCVTGQTQLSGKTSTLEAMVSRSGLKAIAFVTKRGEGAFQYPRVKRPAVNTEGRYDGSVTAPHYVKPYFRHRADWQFVSDILGAILSEKLKFQRPWIMQVCRGAKTLEDVRIKVVDHLYGNKQKKIKPARGMAEGVYTELEEYLKMLMPELERLPYTDKLDLQTGLNVMDLSVYSTPLQMLVISSVLEWIYKNETGVITVIPEAWEFVPNGRNSPAKTSAGALIRKGAGLHNFIWLDSQDLASVDTELRRACGVWILGVQREQNEVKRVLAHVPIDTPKPKPKDIMELERGQFFVCFGREVRKVYVQPAWLAEEDARAVAIGTAPVPIPPFIEFPAMAEGQEGWELAIPTRKFGHVGAHHEVKLAKTHEEVRKFAAGKDYHVAPEGVPFFVDGGKSVDQQERERYETQIDDLKEKLLEAEKQIRLRDGDPFIAAEMEGRAAASALTDSLKRSLEADLPSHAKGPGSSGKQLYEITNLFNLILNSPPSLEQLAKALVTYLPAGGTIKVEPREVVLNRFQKEQVSSILEAVKKLSPWQRLVIAWMEAKRARQQKADIFRAILHRDPSGGQGQTDRYKAIDDLVSLGYLRKDGTYVRENLTALITSQLNGYEAKQQEIADVVGQVMLKLK